MALGVAIIGFFIWLFVAHADDFDDDTYNDDPFASSLVVDVTR